MISRTSRNLSYLVVLLEAPLLESDLVLVYATTITASQTTPVIANRGSGVYRISTHVARNPCFWIMISLTSRSFLFSDKYRCVMVFFHTSHSSLEWMAPELVIMAQAGSGNRRARSGELEAGQDMNQQSKGTNLWVETKVVCFPRASGRSEACNSRVLCKRFEGSFETSWKCHLLDSEWAQGGTDGR